MKREPIFPHVITSSTRALFNSCPQKYFNAIACGLVPKGNPGNVHLFAGKAYAKALEAFRMEFFKSTDYDKAVAAGLVALFLGYGKDDPPEGETKTIERMVGAYIEYLIRYPPFTEHAKPVTGLLGPKVEFSFAFEVPDCSHPVTGDPILFGGTLDKLAEFNALYFVYDDKTTGAMGKLWKHQWDLRSQFTGYVYGIKNAVPAIAEKVVGAIIRGMCILKTEYKSEEVITYRPDWMIERWKERLIWDVKRMIQCWNDSYWPNTGEENGECVRFRPCAYHTLCTSKYPENYIDVEYEVIRKDPITHEVTNDEIEQ